MISAGVYASPRPEFQIVSLRTRPDLVPLLARWHHAEWGALMAPWSLAEAQAELEAHAATGGCPTTLVALDTAGAALGSVSLLLEDAPALRDYSPWLASLYVRADVRQLGIGAALVQALCAHAAGLGIETLYLFTPADGRWYQRLGWRHLGSVNLGLHAVQVMERSVMTAGIP